MNVTINSNLSQIRNSSVFIMKEAASRGYAIVNSNGMRLTENEKAEAIETCKFGLTRDRTDPITREKHHAHVANIYIEYDPQKLTNVLHASVYRFIFQDEIAQFFNDIGKELKKEEYGIAKCSIGMKMETRTVKLAIRE
ncbi:MAG: hypothetical protein ABR981_01170 [Candidatus Micrarchaeaceae archaeon]|jgi:hypothetical protein